VHQLGTYTVYIYIWGRVGSGLLFTSPDGRPLMFRNVARSLSGVGFEGLHCFR
jgi:hypothetical protein